MEPCDPKEDGAVTLMKIVIICEDTRSNRISAERLFVNIKERGNLPITRSLDDAYEMGKVSREIDVAAMYIEPETQP